jgi:hypothetical protein
VWHKVDSSTLRFSVYATDIPAPSRHVELPQNTDDTALVATSRISSLLVGNLEAYLGRLEMWLWYWRIAINVSKITAVLFVMAARRIQKPRPAQFLEKPIQWVETTRYLGVNLDTQITCSRHVNQVRKKAAQWLGVLVPLLNRRSSLSVRYCVLLYKQLIRYDGLRVSDLRVRYPQPCPKAASLTIQVSSHCE